MNNKKSLGFSPGTISITISPAANAATIEGATKWQHRKKSHLA
jgi:hypothetical protein